MPHLLAGDERFGNRRQRQNWQIRRCQINGSTHSLKLCRILILSYMVTSLMEKAIYKEKNMPKSPKWVGDKQNKTEFIVGDP